MNNFLCGHVFTPLGYTGNVQKMRAGRLTPGVGGVQRPPSHLLTHPPSLAPRSLRHRLTTREAGLEGWRTWREVVGRGSIDFRVFKSVKFEKGMVVGYGIY